MSEHGCPGQCTFQDLPGASSGYQGLPATYRPASLKGGAAAEWRSIACVDFWISGSMAQNLARGFVYRLFTDFTGVQAEKIFF